MSGSSLTPEIEAALSELREAFPGKVSHGDDGQGGVDVTVADLELGPRWERPRAALTFNLAYNYPFTPIYPYYLPEGTSPIGGWPQALQNVAWKGANVVQVSLRFTTWDPSRDNAVGCVYETRRWLQEQR